MTKKKYQKHKKNITNKKIYGGIKTNEEVLKATDTIVKTLFSREKNIFYFLEFIKVQLNSSNDDDFNDAIAINDTLNVFTLLIELINSKIYEIDNQQTLKTIQNSEEKIIESKSDLDLNKVQIAIPNAENVLNMDKLPKSNTIPSSVLEEDDVPEEDDENKTWKTVQGLGGAVFNHSYKKKHLKFKKFMKGGNTNLKSTVFGVIFNLWSSFDYESETFFSEEEGINKELPQSKLPIKNDVEEDSDDELEFHDTIDLEENRIKIQESQQQIDQLFLNPSIGDINLNSNNFDAGNISTPVPDLTLTTTFENLDETYPDNWKESFLKFGLDSTESIYNFITELIKIYSTKKIMILKSENLTLLQSAANKFSLFFISTLKKIAEATPNFNFASSESIPMEGMVPAKLLNPLISQEDIDNYNLLNKLETDLVNLTIKFKNILAIKLKNINDKSILLLLSNKFYKEFHLELKKFILKYKDQYKKFIGNLIIIKKESNVLSSALKIREVNKFFQDNIFSFLTNKELLNQLASTYGTILDVKDAITLKTSIMAAISGNILEYFYPTQITTSSILTSVGTTLASNDSFKILIEKILNYNEIRSSGVIQTDTTLENELKLNTMDGILASNPITHSFKKARTALSSIGNLLYRNAESTKGLLDQIENKSQMINLFDNVSNLIEDSAYQVISFSYKNDDLWRLIITKESSYKYLPSIQLKIKKQYSQIFFDYRKLIVDINSAICKIRCIDTFLPETVLDSAISDDNTDIENISYSDLQEIEYTTMYLFISKKYTEIGDTLLFLDNLLKQLNEAYNIKYKLEDLCEFIKSEILKILESLTPKGTMNPARWSPTGVRRGLFGGARNLPENTKEEILTLICNIMLCDLKIKFGINQETEIDRTNNLLLLNNSRLELKKISQITPYVKEISGDELLEYIQANNYDKFLERVYQIYNSKLSITPNQNEIDDTSFLDTINSSINDLRIKLSFEFFRLYLNSEDYKLFKKEQQEELDSIFNETPITLNEIKNVASKVLLIGGKGLLMFSPYYQKLKQGIAYPIGALARATGFDIGLTNLEKAESTMKTPIRSTMNAGSKKKNNKRNNKVKTKKIKTIIKRTNNIKK
jgi:hypothetical protein